MYIWMHKVSPEKEGNFSAMELEYVGCRKCASNGVDTSAVGFNSEKVCCKGRPVVCTVQCSDVVECSGKWANIVQSVVE